MSEKVVVVGAGYAGAGTVKSFEDEIDPGEAELTWVSDHNYHLLLHEVHRCIRKPEVESKVTIPVEEIKEDDTEFVRDRVTGVDTDDRSVELADGEDIDYDYLLVAVGSETAFFGIEGLEEHALTLKSLDDAREIHQQVVDAAADADEDDPAQVIVGGAGLSGIQAAGEIAELRDERDYPLEIKLVEGLDQVFPGNDPRVQGSIRKHLLDHDIEILTGDFISKADEDAVYLGSEDDDDRLEHDVLLWTGGITGREEFADTVDSDDRSKRLLAESTFETSDDRVFSLGDSALVEQDDEEVAPPTAQAAWQAAEVAGENLARALRGAPLKTWTHTDKGTVISVGDDVVAHDVQGIPVNTFSGPIAETLKKGIAARWIATVSSPTRAISAWNDM
ncbi:NAD(P)/FAD-dependent oxidoreductase [Candidatus Halobonum tyrrellensis]|uniref:NADH dehydrogenase n=1 Tax=Candidatus Halobonum tyrrellensis G22 TaxID=1324957 RepID=V4HDD8_9EURY|nr:FAD-dependent oxidoreductase [Candidatus Halobonum tyrrellensis]ESP88730.1 NADH dehydrogenase [Candidatus Halobonum tyrrellensis G22]